MAKPKVSSNGARSQLIFAGAFIVIAAVCALIFNALTEGHFLQWMNIKIILGNMIYPTFMAWGMCFLFACGYTDMSWGAVVVLASFATGVLGNMYGLAAGMLCGIFVGTGLVFFNFWIFSATKIPAWIASLSLAMVYEAFAIFLQVNNATKAAIAKPFDKSLRFLGQFPYSLIVLLVCFAVIYFIYNRTTVGFNIRAIGGNERVARSLGVNVDRTLLHVGIICGLLIGVTSFLQESYSGYTTAKNSLASIFLILQPLAIALLSDILQKKVNIVIAVPICAFLMYAVFNLLTLLHVPSGTLQEAMLALFIIAFGIIGQRGVQGVVK